MYDMETNKVIARLSGHEDDVNAVAFAEESPHVILSGSDDTLIRVRLPLGLM